MTPLPRAQGERPPPGAGSGRTLDRVGRGGRHSATVGLAWGVPGLPVARPNGQACAPAVSRVETSLPQFRARPPAVGARTLRVRNDGCGAAGNLPANQSKGTP